MEEHFGIKMHLGESELVSEGVVIRIIRFLAQTPLEAGPGLDAQPCCEVPGDFRVKMQ